MKTNTHPYKPFVPEQATKLIIGTIPPERFCINKDINENDVNFYYGSKDNGFYKLISEVAGVNFSYANDDNAVNERKHFLKEHNLGITDMIEKCNRINGSSLDRDLRDIEYRDIKAILSEHPNINTLLCTSIEARWMIYRSLGSKVENEFRITQQPKCFEINIEGKTYKVVELYSPSRRACRKGIAEKRLEQYKTYFSK